MANVRPKSAGFVVLNTKTGIVVADDNGQPFKRREMARAAVRRLFQSLGFEADSLGRFPPEASQSMPIGILQVMLYPGETYTNSARY